MPHRGGAVLPTIAIAYTNRIPADTFAEFRRLVDAEGLGLQVEEREEDGPYAGLEWLIPTAVIVFIGNAYFGSFLKEMGKDHYALLKAGLKSLHSHLLGPKAPEVVVLSTKGKASSDQPYSLLYSLLAEGEGGIRFKLLLQRSATQEEYEATVNAFLAFLEAYHAGTLEPSVVSELQKTRVMGKTLLLAFNPSLNRVQPVDPLSSKAANGA
jgi:hypothetical protein